MPFYSIDWTFLRGKTSSEDWEQNTLLDKMLSQYAVSWREELNNHTEKNIKQENKGQNKDCYMLKGMKEVIFGQ